MGAAISLTGGGGYWSHWWRQLLVSLVGVAIGLTGGAAISLTGGGGYWSRWWGQLLVSLVGVAIGLTGGGSY